MFTMGRQSGLTLEQRTEAVLSLLRREEPGAKIARRWHLGADAVSLSRSVSGSQQGRPGIG